MTTQTIVKKTSKTNIIKIYINVNNQEYLTCRIVLTGPKKITDIELIKFPCTDSYLESSWDDGYKKGESLTKAIQSIMIGKSYTQFLLTSTNSHEEI